MKSRILVLALICVDCPALLDSSVPARAAGSDATAGPTSVFPFFAMNFAMHDARYAAPAAQAELLKELGYDGSAYLGDPAGLVKAIQVLDANGLRTFTAYLYPNADISVDPGSPKYDPRIKDMLAALKGRDTLLVICFVSRQYACSSPEGDDRAVEVAREIADHAQRVGARVAIYPHVGYWAETVGDAVRIAQKANRRNLGVCFNLFHWLKTDPERKLKPTIDLALPYLFLVTICGFTRDGSIETLDRGLFDVYPLLKTLQESGYAGPIGLQCVGLGGDPRENLRRSMEAWRKLSARLAAENSQGPVKHGNQPRN
jgi:sugar phosphate isomerase/epimerase